MKGIPNRNELRERFEVHAQRRLDIVRDLTERIEKVFTSHTIHPTVKGRTKDFSSYYKKTLRFLKANGADGSDADESSTNGELPRITDLMGVRIVCPFIEDLSAAEDLIKENFDVVEVERKSHGTFKEFGYESTHLLVNIPAEIIAVRGTTECDMAEVQIRTILQDAWAEVEHELVYKAEFNPFDTPMKRKLAAVNASLSLADIVFQEIRTYQRQLNGELGKRRESFFQKIEDENDSFLFASVPQEEQPPILPMTDDSFEPHGSIDDHLLLALSAHNRGRFDEAITLYSRILKLEPDDTIASIIYKHRGMANFAQSKYQDAIDDFSHSTQLDSSSYKAFYYRGVVKSVIQDYSGAIEDYTLSLAIHPYQAFCLFRRGQAYYHLGDMPEALSDCDASLAIEPDNEAAHKFKDLLQDELKM